MKVKRIIGLLLVLCMLFGAVFAPSFSAGTQNSVQAYLDEQVEKYDINGVVYATKNGELVCMSARGVADAETSKEMTVDTLFPVGSISKQFCAAAILLLKEQGKINVDEPILTYFPEYTIAKDVTVKNLLTMRSGVVDHFNVGLKNGEYTLSTDATTEENQQAILEWLYTKELLSKPNLEFEYSNTNYFLLSIIVEKVSGQRYQEFIKENIFVPLGMDNTGFHEELANHPDLADYIETDEPFEPDYKGLTRGAGDIVSNAKDMDKWMTSLREHTILTEASVKEMTINYSPQFGFGYGVGISRDGGINFIGGILSYVSMMLTYPEEGINVFAVTNDVVDEDTTPFATIIVPEIAQMLKSSGICGDVTEDGVVNIKDATAIQKYIAGLVTLSQKGCAAADADASGAVNIKDATAIQKHIAGMDTGLNIGGIV